MSENTVYDFENKIKQLQVLEENKEFDKVYALSNEILEHDENCAEAYLYKGICLYYGAGVEQDVDGGLTYLIKGANLGDSECQKTLLNMYMDGFKTCALDVERAARETAAKVACHIGSRCAMAGLAIQLSEENDSEENDEEKARQFFQNSYKYFNIARQAGYPKAEEDVVRLLNAMPASDIEKIPDLNFAYEIEMAMPLAKAGNADAMMAIYLLMLKGPDSNADERLYWLEQAVLRGKSDAVRYYGGMWRIGIIEDDDFNCDSYIRGCEALLKSNADLVDAEMLGTLGECYMSDRSSMKDLDAAERYLTQAADGGDRRSIRSLALGLLAEGELRTNDDKALVYLNQIIENDDDQDFVENVICLTADIYLRRNTDADADKAEVLLRRVENSHDDNIRNIARETLASIVEVRRRKQEASILAQNLSEEAPKKSGCYIATAVYGAYDCPQVCTLRRYRDDVLAESALGRLFIRIYYKFSPKLVKYFGQTRCFNAFWHGVLDKWVQHLQDKGFKGTPYQDRDIEQ